MSIYYIEKEQRNCLNLLFKEWNETLIWSCLQGCMGKAWADNPKNPKSAQIITADFCFFAGEPKEELVLNRPEYIISDFIIMVPENKKWESMIQDIYGENTKKVTRYAIKKEKHNFITEKLCSYVDALSNDYTIKMINEELFNQIIENDWSRDLCSQFEDYQDYKKRGLGSVVLHDKKIVSGASSYTVYHEGIEIEIDTQKDYRRKGLALACGARLILECLDKNLYPSWDAQNKASVALAEKLGYHYEKDYTAFEVYTFGTKAYTKSREL